MKIIVLNGSPKGDESVTMQYIHFIEKKFPENSYKILNIGQKIKKIEKDEDYFKDIILDIESADIIIWGSPVYYLLIPSNYKRFIELIFERGVESSFKDKYTITILTSIHFYDHTALNYLHSISDDLNMRYFGTYSADMYDLTKSKEREKLIIFIRNFFEEVNNNLIQPKEYLPLIWNNFDYTPTKRTIQLNTDKKILIITDYKDEINLINMINTFKESFSNNIEVANLWNLKIKGSCLGCIQCGYDNSCIYGDKDDYIKFYKEKVISADILIFAGAIKDRYLSSRWKTFFDRAFFLGHAPSLSGKQIGYIISGPLAQTSNLKEIFEAYTEIQHANLAGIITDESQNSELIEQLLQNFATRIIKFSETSQGKPLTFLGVGGMKIFRDAIWGRLRFPFKADYDVYKSSDVFNFPQDRYKMRFRNQFMLLLSKSSKFRKEVNSRMKKEMIKPLQNIVKDK